MSNLVMKAKEINERRRIAYTKITNDFIVKKVADAILDDLDFIKIEPDMYDIMNKYDLLKDEWLIFESGNRYEVYHYKIYFRNIEKRIGRHKRSSKWICRIPIFFIVVTLLIGIFQK